MSHGSYIFKVNDDQGLEDEFKKLDSMPLHLVSFLLSNCKRIMNSFAHAINGF